METTAYGTWYLVLFVLLLLSLYFFSRAIQKAGYSPWWALLGIVPVVNIAMLWVFAFSRWPRVPERPDGSHGPGVSSARDGTGR